jgi:hypothetical protein
MPVNVHGQAAGSSTRLHVDPSIPDHEAPPRIESEVGCRRIEQAGRRFTAPTAIGLIMRADVQAVHQDLTAELTVDVVEHLHIEFAPSNIGLVGNHHQD